MAEPSVTPSRYHALDSLRAAMMFLGIYLHVVVAYSPTGGWPLKPPGLTTKLDYSMVLIHVFRMPVFYTMAGFFTALLLQRYGFGRAAWNRFLRIAVPFALGWIIVYPLMIFLMVWAGRGFARASDVILSGRFLANPHPMHLWFLEYLIVLYVLAIPVVVAVRRFVPAGVQQGGTKIFRRVVQSPLGLLPLAAVSFVALLPMRYAGLDDPPSFVPAPHIVFAYAIPFAFGWLLFANADLLDTLRRRAWPYTAFAVAAGIANIVLIYSIPDRGGAFYASRALHALAMWGFIFGITGLFLRYLSGHSPLGRYLCDSSYFLYIAHLPLIIAFQVLLEGVALPPLAKIPLVLIGTAAVLLPLYRFAVRPTFIGAILNGRRYPLRSAPIVAVTS
jgi:glucan biosynthesis protein C